MVMPAGVVGPDDRHRQPLAALGVAPHMSHSHRGGGLQLAAAGFGHFHNIDPGITGAEQP